VKQSLSNGNLSPRPANNTHGSGLKISVRYETNDTNLYVRKRKLLGNKKWKEQRHATSYKWRILQKSTTI